MYYKMFETEKVISHYIIKPFLRKEINYFILIYKISLCQLLFFEVLSPIIKLDNNVKNMIYTRIEK